MPGVELAGAPVTGAPMAGAVERSLSGWGRVGAARCRVLTPGEGSAEAVAERVVEVAADPSDGGLIARGAGRSYGDAAQNAGGWVLDTGALNAIESVDVTRREVSAQAGVRVGELMARLARDGLTLPVVPGTRHVTLGGAIASDIHGKNHHRDGALARHVLELTLCLPSGELVTVSPAQDPELLYATLGGMGLTGTIVSARIRALELPVPWVAVDTERTDGLSETLASMSAEDGRRYSVAWLDLLAGGARNGRAVIARADPLAQAPVPSGGRGFGLPGSFARGGDGRQPRSDEPLLPLRDPRVTVPEAFPSAVLSSAGVRAFNAMRWRAAPRSEHARPTPIEPFFFPLDGIGAWNRMYGPAGLVQYQLAIPDGREAELERCFAVLRERRLPVYLAVFKRFGEEFGGPLSFPLAGWTLAIDLPAGAEGLERGLRELDEIVAGAGGRVYLTKDSRLPADTLRAMYPKLEGFRAVRERVDPDGLLRSDLAVRLGLCEAAAPGRVIGMAGLGAGGGGAGAGGAAAGVDGSLHAASAKRPMGAGSEQARRVMVLGGSSEIALAIVSALQERAPREVCLVGRDEQRLELAASALGSEGVERVLVERLDALDVEHHGERLREADAALGGTQLAVLAVGVLGADGGRSEDVEDAVGVLSTNVVGAGSLLLRTAELMRARGGGTIVVLSSVAAQRPRRSNAVYGASKAGLDALAQGLADRLHGDGVRILVVRPGFVRTRMTSGLDAAPLAVSAQDVAQEVVRALNGDQPTVWAPRPLRAVMLALRMLPRPLWRRMKL